MKSRRTAWILAVVIAVSVAALLTYRSAASRQSGADAPKPHSVTLTWNPAWGATSYNVYRSSVSGKDYKPIGSTKEPKYVDTPVPSGTAFYYVVTSVSGKGESRYSTEMKAVIP